MDVNIATVLELRKLNYGWQKIAEILGISRATLYRRLNVCGISSYTPLTNNQLDDT